MRNCIIEFKFAYWQTFTEKKEGGGIHVYRGRITGIEIIEAEIPQWVLTNWNYEEREDDRFSITLSNLRLREEAYKYLKDIGNKFIKGLSTPIAIVEA
jgi:hypothetical protein